jgi:hypothetical protein
MKYKNIFLTICIIFLAALLVWMFMVLPNLKKFNNTELRNYITTGYDRAYYGGNYTEGIQVIHVKDSLVSIKGNFLVINSNSIGADRYTGQIFWNASATYAVDSVSRKNIPNLVEGVTRMGYFIFPPNVEKINYEFSSPEVLEKQGIVKFESETTFRGLRCYNFSFNLEELDKTVYFPLLNKGEKIIGTHKGSLLVEPNSGVILHFEHSGVNKLYDPNGNFVMDYEIWQNSFTEQTISNQIVLANSLNSDILFYNAITWVLAGIIIILLITYFIVAFNKD